VVAAEAAKDCRDSGLVMLGAVVVTQDVMSPADTLTAELTEALTCC
jgi:hypothetical protein